MLVYHEMKSTDKVPTNELNASYMYMGCVAVGLVIALVGYIA